MNAITLPIGGPLPQFSLPAIDGNNYSNNSFGNKKLLCIIFSCNHCPYVQAYEQRIMDLQNEFREEMQIVAINSNDEENYPEDSFENMVRRAEEKKFNFVYLRDEDQTIAEKFGATHTPEVFLFGEDRTLIYRGKIDDNWKEPENVVHRYLREAILEYLEGVEISVPETFSIGCTIKWKA